MVRKIAAVIANVFMKETTHMIGINVLTESHTLLSTHIEEGGKVRIHSGGDPEKGIVGSSDTYTCKALREFYEVHGPAPVKIVDGRLQTRRSNAAPWTRYLYIPGTNLVSSLQICLASPKRKVELMAA